MPPTTRPVRALALAAALLLAGCGGTAEPVVDDPAAAPTQDETATASPAPATTPSSDDPSPTAAPAAQVDPCDDPPANLIGIELSSPQDGDQLADGDEIVGCGSTFEANFQWRVEYDAGGLDEGFGTMTCGNGCVGTFAEPVALTGSGPATLTVYETSAQDGSEINVLTRSVVVP